MKAEKNKVVAVSYELEVEGTIADKAGVEKPLEYIHGTGMLLPLFEAAVEGKEPGECFDFTLSPEDGYGTYQKEYVVSIPKAAFCGEDGVVREDLLTVGNIIPMLDNTGNVLQGVVKEVGKDSVTMDFNHPMAGKVLHFTGSVVSVREASCKELAEGLHGEYLPKEGCHCHGEGCGCHGEGGECGCHGEGEECGCHGEGEECGCHGHCKEN